MTATVLNLKIRPNRAALIIPINQARALLNGGTDADRERFMADVIKRVAELGPVHDRAWLELICNWLPDGGLSLVQQAPWIKIAARVANLDETREGEFHLSPQDVDLIWKRLINPDFKPRRDAAFDGFLVDFMNATGREFPEQNG